MPRVIRTTWFADMGYYNVPLFDFKLMRLTPRQLIVLLFCVGMAYFAGTVIVPLFFSDPLYMLFGAAAVFAVCAALLVRRGRVFAPEWYLYYFVRKAFGFRKPTVMAGAKPAKRKGPAPAIGAKPMIVPLGEPTRIVGVLFDPSTGRRLANAVYDVEVDGKPYDTGRTDKDGAYSIVFTPPQPGAFNLTVKLKGSKVVVEAIRVEAGGPKEQESPGAKNPEEKAERAQLKEAPSKEEEEEKKVLERLYVYELFPMNFISLPDKEQDRIVNGFRSFLNSLDTPVKIMAVRSSKEVEIGGTAFRTEYFRFFVLAEEPLEAQLETAGLSYQRTTEIPYPNQVHVTKSFVAVEGGRTLRTATVCELPQTLIEGFLCELYGIVDRIVLSVKPLPQGDAVAKLEKHYRLKLGFAYGGRVQQQEIAEGQMAQEALNRLTMGESRLFQVIANITVGGSTEAELSERMKRLRSHCRGKLIYIDAPLFVQDDLLRGDLGKVLYADTVTLGAFFPFVSADMIETPGGVCLGVNRMTGAPVIFDPYLRMNQNIAVIGVSGAGKCVAGSTLIVNPETGDLVRIDQVVNKKEGKVLTLGSDLKLAAEKPIAYYENGFQDVYELRTRLGKKIRVTAEHPFLTISGWKACKDLRKGERIAVPRVIPVFGNEDMPDYQVKALAYMLADGCAPKKGTIRFTDSDENTIKDFIECVSRFHSTYVRTVIKGKAKEVFVTGSRPSNFVSDPSSVIELFRAQIEEAKKDRKKKIETQIALYKAGLSPLQISTVFHCTREAVVFNLKKAGVYRPIIVKTEFRKWLKELNIHGKLSYEKEIPSVVFRLKKEKLALFLNRLFACDGWATFTGGKVNIGYSSSSEKIATQVQHLLLRFGVVAKLREKKTKKQPAYLVEIQNLEMAKKFLEEIGDFQRKDFEAIKNACMSKHSNTNVDTIPKEVWSRVRAIKQEKEKTWKEISHQRGLKNKKGLSSYFLHCPSRPLLKFFAEALGSEELRALAESDIFWDEVVSVTYAGKEPTYDLSMNPTHNFVANDIIVHNSYAAKTLLTRLLERDPDTAFFIIDPENEYARAMLPVDLTAQVVHVGRSRKLGLDPFLLFPGAKDMVLNILSDLLGVADDPDMLSELQVAVQRSSSLQDLYKNVGKALRKRLDGLLKGTNSFLFSGKPEPIKDRAIFSFRELHQAIQVSREKGALHLASLLIFGKIWKRIEEMPRERLKVVIVDEVWLYSQLPISASFLESVARRGRKRNVLFVLCSQRPADVFASEKCKAVIENCATKILFNQDEASANLIREAFDLTDFEIEQCTNFSQGEAILLSKGIRVPIRFMSTPEEHARFTTKPTEAL
ncbi:MAG: ATP-binding protein [Hadesarchaea archaeon]|nr:ATP-binding protein [Hadesarchaea archaeon]